MVRRRDIVDEIPIDHVQVSSIAGSPSWTCTKQCALAFKGGRHPCQL